MKKRLSVVGLIAVAASVLSVQAAHAAREVGYNHILLTTAPGGSDTLLTVPFHGEPVGTFTVLAETGTGVTVSGTPFTADALENTHYARFSSGAASGLPLKITNNTASALDLANWTRAAAHVAPGDTFTIYKYWTIGTLFPKTMLGVSHVAGNVNFIFPYLPNLDLMKKNLAAAGSSVCNVNGDWVGAFNANSVLEPETQFLFRNSSGQVLKYLPHGIVPQYDVRKLIAAGPSGGGDLTIGTGYPVPQTLNGSGICGPAPVGQQRTVFRYSNTAIGKNKAASGPAALCNNGNWVGGGITGNEILEPAAAFTLRLPQTEAGTIIKINRPYQNQK